MGWRSARGEHSAAVTGNGDIVRLSRCCNSRPGALDYVGHTGW
jgi:hypothetical protein